MTTTKPTVSEQSSQSHDASVITGVTKQPAKPKRPSATKSAAKPVPAKPARKMTAKIATMNAMIHASADLVRSDAAFKSAQRKYPDLRPVSRAEARGFLSARLSYAPGDEWDDALDQPTKLQSGKRSATARAA
jgi:hypothetical protein